MHKGRAGRGDTNFGALSDGDLAARFVHSDYNGDVLQLQGKRQRCNAIAFEDHGSAVHSVQLLPGVLVPEGWPGQAEE